MVEHDSIWSVNHLVITVRNGILHVLFIVLEYGNIEFYPKQELSEYNKAQLMEAWLKQKQVE